MLMHRAIANGYIIVSSMVPVTLELQMHRVGPQAILIEIMRPSQESKKFKLVNRILYTQVYTWSLLCHKMLSKQSSASDYS